MLLQFSFEAILTQFFVALFFASIIRGNCPSSRSTPSFVDYFCTPNSCLKNDMNKFSIGLFAGIFSIPQKSLTYSNMGSMRLRKSWIEVVGCLSNVIPIFFFSLYKALSARSFKSFSPEFISPEGVQ